MILGQLDDDVELLLAAGRLGQRAEDGPGLGAPSPSERRPDPAPELLGRHDLQVAELCLRDQWPVDLGKGGRQVLHRLRAERTAERGEHDPRMPQRGLDIRPSRSATRLSPPPACLMASMISS